MKNRIFKALLLVLAVLLQYTGDKLDEYRAEYNGILNGAVAEANNIVKVR